MSNAEFINSFILGVAPTTPYNAVLQRTNPKDLMLILDKPTAMMSMPFHENKIGPTDCLISGLAMFQGDVNGHDVIDSIYATNSKQSYGASLLPFSDIDCCISYPQAPNRSALLALNHSLFSKRLTTITRQFSAMINKKVYLKHFISEDSSEEEVINLMYQAKDKVAELCTAYSEPWQYCSDRRGDAEN